MNSPFKNSRFSSLLAPFLTAVALLLIVGCADNSQPVLPTPTVAPSALQYAVDTAVYTQGTAITANSPTNSGGAVTSYSVTPPLPAGLLLSTSTGVVSGTPIPATPMTVYTVTGSNAGGSTTAALSITVNVAAPAGLAYTSGTAFYIVGMPIPQNVPTSTGGAPSAYSVSPPLPAGLQINGSGNPIAGVTGIISGTPTAVTATAEYTVTATNSTGTATANLTITVSESNSSPAGLAYSAPAPVYAMGVPITPDIPSTAVTGGAPTSFSVSPALPSGLTLNQTTGVVTGTPSAGSSPTAPPATVTYTVTATNSYGSTTAPLTITLYNSPQWVPNMGQSITPLATTGSSFQFLDTGMVVTDPMSAQVAPTEWLAGQAVSTAVSPDGSTLLLLTSGYNRVFQGPFPLFDPLLSTEYVFIYDITNGAPIFQQVVRIPNTYHGIVWDPIVANHAFYVSGGLGDAPFGTDPMPESIYPLPNNGDNVHIITQDPITHIWSQTGELALGQSSLLLPIALGHPSGNGLPVPNDQFASVNSAVYVAPCAAGLAISADGQTLVVANYSNDSITVFTGGLSNWLMQWQPWAPGTGTLQGAGGRLEGTELDLRPGQGVAGGEYPFWIAMTGTGSATTAYVSSLRDREIDVVSLGVTCTADTPPVCTANPSIKVRIPVKGQPNKMTLNRAETLLYVAEDQSDTVDVIDLKANRVVERIPVIAPASVLQSFSLTEYTGANTNSVTLSLDEKTLFVTNGNLNNIAVVSLTGTNVGDKVVGLIPTGWYPNSVSLSKDGSWAYVVNAKSPTGANPDWCYNYGPTGYASCAAANEYNPQLTKAGLLSFPLAGVTAQLPALTTEVTTNNRFSNTSTPGGVMAAVHQGIQHVIYILKENRTYDQILGDLSRGNGDPNLALFGGAITPNQHALALNFVTLDNFRDTAEVSNDGWPWSTSARAPDMIEHQYPVYYAQRGTSLDSEGVNRNVNVALATLAERQVANPIMPGGTLSPDVPNGENLLPGQTDTAAPDGPNNEINTGYLWDAALRAGLTVRSYGFFVDTTCYNEPRCAIPLTHDPFASNLVVGHSASVALAPFTDPYFRGFDPSFPDYYRYKEWERDFDTNYAAGGLPESEPGAFHARSHRELRDLNRSGEYAGSGPGR